MAGVPQRTAGAGRLRLDGNLDREAETRLERGRGRVVGNPGGAKPGEQQDSPDAVAAELEQQQIEKRRLVDRQQRFRQFGGQRPEPGAAPAAQDDGLLDHAAPLVASPAACQARSSPVEWHPSAD